jgi:hypothetical protein
VRLYSQVVEDFLASQEPAVTATHVAAHFRPEADRARMLHCARVTVRAMFNPDNRAVPWQGGLFETPHSAHVNLRTAFAPLSGIQCPVSGAHCPVSSA